jgi:predicted RNA-binding protein with PUA-like domain
MPAYWLLKSEPDSYNYDDLERDGATVWDGVSNNAALMYIRRVQPRDLALIYHTGDERRAVGLAEITGEAYPDPKLDDAKLAVMDVRALRRLPAPVTLAAIKADPFFADFALVRQGRLSVVPVTEEQWARIMEMAGASR